MSSTQSPFDPDRYMVIERRADIAAPPQQILPHLTNFAEWQAWSPWEDLDPNLQRSYSGAADGVGARYAWKGNRQAGAGQMTITGVSDDEVRIDLLFQKPFKSDSRTRFALQPTAAGTTVVWQVATPKTWLTRIVGRFVNFEKAVGADLEKGLTRLSAAVTAA